MKLKTIIKIIRNDKDIRYGTVMLIGILLLIALCTTIAFIVEYVNF